MMSGPLCFRTMPVRSELSGGTTGFIQRFCVDLQGKELRENFCLLHYSESTDLRTALFPPLPPAHPCSISIAPIYFKQNQAAVPASLHVINKAPSGKNSWPASRIPGQHALQGPAPCDLPWKEFWTLCPQADGKNVN